MYIVIMSYDHTGEIEHEVAHCESIEELETVLEGLPTEEIVPFEVEVAVAVTDAPTDRVFELMNAINNI